VRNSITEVREEIVFEEKLDQSGPACASSSADIFAEMLPYMVDVPNVDDSREAIYTQMKGE